jgi:hypothetical protein
VIAFTISNSQGGVLRQETGTTLSLNGSSRRHASKRAFLIKKSCRWCASNDGSCFLELKFLLLAKSLDPPTQAGIKQIGFSDFVFGLLRVNARTNHSRAGTFDDREEEFGTSRGTLEFRDATTLIIQCSACTKLNPVPTGFNNANGRVHCSRMLYSVPNLG